MASVGEQLSAEKRKCLAESFQSEESKNFIANHPKMSAGQLIDEMSKKGISFMIMSKEEAKRRLMYNTYHFKVGVYRFNYQKDQFGKYKDLEFAYLDDLAILDMRFRRIMLDMSLNLEHSLKTMVQSNVARDPLEDGYAIVKDFEINSRFDIEGCFSNYSNKNHYLHSIGVKHSNVPSIWVLLELLSFGELSKFIEFYHPRTTVSKKMFKMPSRLLRYAKNVRNAAAHNNPLLVNLNKGAQISPDPKIMQVNSEIGLNSEIYRNPKVNDIICLFYLHDLCCSEGVKSHLIEELRDFQLRAKRNSKYYLSNEHLINLYETLDIMIDYYSEK